MVPVGPDPARWVSNRRRRGRILLTTAALVVVITAPAVAFTLVSRDTTPDVATSPTLTVPATTASTSPTPTATPEVEPTDVPVAAMLQQSDVPAEFTYEGEDIDGDWTLEFSGQFCAPPNNMGDQAFGVNRGASFRSGTGPESTAILERVDRHSVTDARVYLQAVRNMVQGCVPVAMPVTWTVVREGFAGDESLILTLEIDGYHSTYVVVRHGGLVAQIWYKDATSPDPVQLGQRAAARLCAGTTAC